MSTPPVDLHPPGSPPAVDDRTAGGPRTTGRRGTSGHRPDPRGVHGRQRHPVPRRLRARRGGGTVRLESGVAGGAGRWPRSLGWVDSLAIGRACRPVVGAGRGGRTGRVVAGAQPPGAALPARLHGLATGRRSRSRGRQHPRPQLLYHRFGGLQPGRRRTGRARAQSLHGFDGTGHPAAQAGLPVLDLHRVRWDRDPRLVPGGILPLRRARPPPRFPSRNRRLDGPVCMAGHRRAPVRAGSRLGAVAGRAGGGHAAVRRHLQFRWHRRRLPTLLGVGRVAVGPVFPRAWCRPCPVDGPGGPRTGLFHQTDPLVLCPVLGGRTLARGPAVGASAPATGSRVPGRGGGGVRRSEPAVHHLAAHRLEPWHPPSVHQPAGGRRPGTGHPGPARGHSRGVAHLPHRRRTAGLCSPPGRHGGVVPVREAGMDAGPTGGLLRGHAGVWPPTCSTSTRPPSSPPSA